MQPSGDQGHGEGADPVEGGVAEGDHAGRPKQEVVAQREKDRDHRQARDVLVSWTQVERRPDQRQRGDAGHRPSRPGNQQR